MHTFERATLSIGIRRGVCVFFLAFADSGLMRVSQKFEELVDQFIPSDMSWKGWLKMAFHQPLVPVLPVARELISKTKWIANNKSNGQDLSSPPKARKAITYADDEEGEPDRSHSPHLRWRKSRKRGDSVPPVVAAAYTAEPEEGLQPPSRPPSRNRKFTLFGRTKTNNSGSTTGSTTASDL
jgi:hypothetical protein